jgi:hypothetical protein
VAAFALPLARQKRFHELACQAVVFGARGRKRTHQPAFTALWRGSLRFAAGAKMRFMSWPAKP